MSAASTPATHPPLLQRATETTALLSLLEKGALKEAVALWQPQQQPTQQDQQEQQLRLQPPSRPAAATAVNADASCAAGLLVAPSIPAQLTTPAIPSPSIPLAMSEPVIRAAAAGDPAVAVAHTLQEHQQLHTEPELTSAVSAGHIMHRQKLYQKEARAARRVYVSYLAPHLVSGWVMNVEKD